MRAKHWRWIAYGLAGWSVLVWLWATGPHNCTPPNHQRHVSCQH